MTIHHPSLDVRRHRIIPSIWDALTFALIIGTLTMIGRGSHETFAPLSTLKTSAISLDPWMLPHYALRTTLRMFGAMAASVIFTLTYATAAAKSKRAEIVLIPLLDILQSVPILGFLSFTVTGFMALFPGQVLGVELAAVFAVFTSQAWNMAFSFYQSLRTIPQELDEAARNFGLSPWQRFWKLEVPFGMPGLVWNAMMSMSGSWFFVVAAEAISVGSTTITLPGIGSYVGLAIARADMRAVGWAVLAMLLVIIAYDQLLFRPIVAWAQKFHVEQSASAIVPRSWLLELIRRARLFQYLMEPMDRLGGRIAWLNLRTPVRAPRRLAGARINRWMDRLWLTLVIIIAALALWRTSVFIFHKVALSEVGLVFGLGLLTLLRVAILIAVASLIWVPVGVWVGLRPRLVEYVQPLAQFLAAFPANIAFPFAVAGIVRWHLVADIWLTPLMVLGTQWYILFNVIAGASAFPTDLREAATNLGVRGWRWWFKIILPGVFPYYVTGALTASGGSWNASIVAEIASWGKTTLVAHGIGAYIAQATIAGDFPRIVLGIAVMSLYVTLFNRLLWRPMFRFAEQRTRLQ